MNRAICVFSLVCLLPVIAEASVPDCDALKGSQAATASAVLESAFMYECCDETIAKCLRANQECRPRVEAVAGHVCRMAGSGADRTSIERSLEKRAMTLTGPVNSGVIQASSGLAPGYVLGDSGVPVTVVMYTCVRCPFCSRLVPPLVREVQSGRLKGLVRLVVRPFPIKSHPGSAEANQALTAAASLGGAWSFILEAYRRFDTFSESTIPDIAAAAGIDRGRFAVEYASAAARQALVESKKEGLRFGVASTPTLFVNGRRYQSELEVGTLVDILVEAAAGKVQAGSLK